MLWFGLPLARTPRDDRPIPQHQPARLRPPKPLAAAEDRDIGPEIAREAPEVGDRRDLRRRVHQHRHAARVGDGDHLLQRQRAGRVAGPREVEHAGSARPDGRFEFPALRRVRHADLDQRRAGLPGGVIVAVAVRPVDDYLVRPVVRVGQPGDRRGVGPRDAGGDRHRDPRRRARRHVAGFVAGQRRDPLPYPRLQIIQIDEGLRPGRHRRHHRRRHPRAAQARQRRRRVDHPPHPQLAVADHLTPPFLPFRGTCRDVSVVHGAPCHHCQC